MTMQISAEGRAKLTEPWEECVLYVYDDKVPKRRINGRMQYPEWDGGPVRGTLTIGFGHTDAAGAPKIKQGMRVTKEEADAILDHDLAPCEAAVNRALKVKVTQHQYDALVDTTFNCPSALPKVAALINAGNLRAVPGKLLQYTSSKGEHMRGLVNRRNAEIAWFNTPDDPEDAEAETIFSPKAERDEPPRLMASSKVGAAATTLGAGSVLEAISAANQAAAPVEEAKDHLVNLGIFDHLVALVQTPTGMIVLGIGLAALTGFIWFDRYAKLRVDHV